MDMFLLYIGHPARHQAVVGKHDTRHEESKTKLWPFALTLAEEVRGCEAARLLLEDRQ